MKYPLAFYTDRFLDEGVGGRAIGPVILIRPYLFVTEQRLDAAGI